MDLEEIGNRSGVEKEDLEAIRRKKRKEMILVPVTGFLITVLSVVAGFLVGKNNPVFDKVYTYPYAGMMLAFHPKKKLWITVAAVTLTASLIGFLAAHELAQPHEYGMAVEYGVYKRQR